MILDLGDDAANKVGYEFVPCSGEQDLTAVEIEKVEQGLEGEHILLVKGSTCKVPQPQQVVLRLQDAAEKFMRKMFPAFVALMNDPQADTLKDIQLVFNCSKTDATGEWGAMIQIGLSSKNRRVFHKASIAQAIDANEFKAAKELHDAEREAENLARLERREAQLQASPPSSDEDVDDNAQDAEHPPPKL